MNYDSTLVSDANLRAAELELQQRDFGEWLTAVTPHWSWYWPHLAVIREQLDRITRREIDRLMIFMHPRIGKSEMTTIRYPVWRLEKNPELKVIIGAYNQTFANKFSRKAKRIAETRFLLAEDRQAVEEWETTKGGGLRAVGVGAGVTGQGGDLIMIDDPVKNREEANSEVYRQKVWDWYTDDLYTRLEPYAAMILIMTRWHEDDLAGRILASEEADRWTVIRIPANAETQADRDKYHEQVGLPIGLPDPLGREPGEATCPDRYDEDMLQRIHKVLGNGYYALYQQRPTAPEGNMFKRSWFKVIDHMPPVVRRVRYWDNAGTENDGAFTCGVLMGLMENGGYCVEDVTRGQWSAYEREQVKRQTAQMDGPAVEIYSEQEPGSGGKESAENTIKNLAGYRVYADRVTGSKVVRAEPFAAQAQAGNVYLKKAGWNYGYLDRITAFPNGKLKDDTDASSGAFNKLVEPFELEIINYGSFKKNGRRHRGNGHAGRSEY